MEIIPRIIPVVVLALCGCADQMMSDARIRNDTAAVLNQPPASVTIANRQYDGVLTTHYTATTPRGSFRCTISGGTVNMFGIADPPECSPLALEVWTPPAPRRRIARRSASSS